MISEREKITSPVAKPSYYRAEQSTFLKLSELLHGGVGVCNFHVCQLADQAVNVIVALKTQRKQSGIYRPGRPTGPPKFDICLFYSSQKSRSGNPAVAAQPEPHPFLPLLIADLRLVLRGREVVPGDPGAA